MIRMAAISGLMFTAAGVVMAAAFAFSNGVAYVLGDGENSESYANPAWITTGMTMACGVIVAGLLVAATSGVIKLLMMGLNPRQ